MDAWEEADLPGEQQWAGMLQRAGISESIGSPYLSEAANRLVMCTSAMPARHGYPCSLWLLFHTLLAHSSPEHAPQTLEAILRYVDVFFSCAECVAHFRSLALHLSPPPAAAPAAGAASAGGGGGGGEEEEEARGAAAPLAGGSAAFRRLSPVVRRIRLVASRRVQAASLGGASADQAKFAAIAANAAAAAGVAPPPEEARDAVELWLWAAHNEVNARLRKEIAAGDHAFAEFTPVAWPPREDCVDCAALLPKAASKGGAAARRRQGKRRASEAAEGGGEEAEGWVEPAVLKQLHAAYCLEPTFYCWRAHEAPAASPGEESPSPLASAAARVGLLLVVLLGCGAACGGCDRRRRDLDKGLPMWMGQASKRGWLGRRRGKAL